MEIGTPEERANERWKRLYSAAGGPLVAWLLEEATLKGMDISALARELRVTPGYLAHLRAGVRDSANISREFAAACAVFLQVPAVVVLVVAGQLQLVDFVCATDFDRWCEGIVGHDQPQPVHLVSGARIGVEELRLLPRMVEALHAGASVHATRAQAV